MDIGALELVAWTAFQVRRSELSESVSASSRSMFFLLVEKKLLQFYSYIIEFMNLHFYIYFYLFDLIVFFSWVRWGESEKELQTSWNCKTSID